MKLSELHRKVKKNGWLHIRTEGSHYIYEKMDEPTLFRFMELKK